MEVTTAKVINLPQVLERKNDVTEVDYHKDLKELGFKKAHQRLEAAKRMKVAYAKYGFISPDKIENFNKKLRDETLVEDAKAWRFKQLVFIPIQDYAEIPPQHVLRRLMESKADDCFDYYEIAKIDWKVQIKDPILFGRIEGCADRFFIAQWDDDVSIEDILGV